ncbi:GntR family transcriptional regulator, partial [Streptomyces finlayi]|uniref:GntR family transcriptional regulator n=1 Tax=Streptomyces finlayi TaxID=67296 RepID=UPI0027E3D741
MEFDPTRPKWQQIADVIRTRIRSGQYPVAHHLSEVAMQQEFGVARDTVRKRSSHLGDSVFCESWWGSLSG